MTLTSATSVPYSEVNTNNLVLFTQKSITINDINKDLIISKHIAYR